ncbi:taurine ABC transporter substrate-binding protein [Zavarzinia aquatilis]|uniref:Taurine ABC transporter substrate-binding protein n=2 Tax=Zavarzinia aquatilis TaxID=2211142 RepID=A0A317DXW2_9PROT|nr:taurine ABC transporter substrate-binding protein [Zavarzinia aquatilis]
MGRFRRGAIAGVLGLAALMGGTGVAEAGKVSIGHFIWVGYGPLYLARDLGYFKENGVEVDLQVVDDSSLAMAAQAAGKLDGVATTVDDILKYRSGDFCFKAVAVLDDSAGGDGIVAAKDIADLAGLKGKTVALNEGSTSQFWFSYLMKKAGLALDAVTVTNMTADAAAAAFIAGHVPAAVTWEPNLTLVKTQNAGKVLVDSSTTPGVIVDVLEFSCKFVEEQPEDVKGIVLGVQKAMDYIKTNRTEAYAIMAKGVGGYLENPKDFADAASGVRFYDKDMMAAYLGTAGAPGAVAEVIKLANEIWIDLGRMKAPVAVADVVDPAFVR